MNSSTKRFRLILAFVLAASMMVFAAGSAWAQNPHFIKVTAALQNGNLAVKFKEAGLGSNQNINYQATTTAEVTCVCVNNSGNCPAAANKKTFTSEVSASGTFPSGKNGTVSATLFITPPACGPSDPPTCGGGQELRLSQVTYTQIKISDLTNGITVFATPSALSKTFFTCP